MEAVRAVTQGAQVSITSLGRHLQGNAFDKHKIKRMDRLVANPHVFRERLLIYKAVTATLLNGLAEPIIVVDWSPLCADQRWHLLRAAVPVGGPAIKTRQSSRPASVPVDPGHVTATGLNTHCRGGLRVQDALFPLH
jgi:hypothetical protein